MRKRNESKEEKRGCRETRRRSRRKEERSEGKRGRLSVKDHEEERRRECGGNTG